LREAHAHGDSEHVHTPGAASHMAAGVVEYIMAIESYL
jgi:hypothetical protein